MMNKFPKSLLEDKTRLGEQCKVVHYFGRDVFLSLENGILSLREDGTWKWLPRFEEDYES